MDRERGIHTQLQHTHIQSTCTKHTQTHSNVNKTKQNKTKKINKNTRHPKHAQTTQNTHKRPGDKPAIAHLLKCTDKQRMAYAMGPEQGRGRLYRGRPPPTAGPTPLLPLPLLCRSLLSFRGRRGGWANDGCYAGSKESGGHTHIVLYTNMRVFCTRCVCAHLHHPHHPPPPPTHAHTR